jgi:hypothetical protein
VPCIGSGSGSSVAVVSTERSDLGLASVPVTAAAADVPEARGAACGALSTVDVLGVLGVLAASGAGCGPSARVRVVAPKAKRRARTRVAGSSRRRGSTGQP